MAADSGIPLRSLRVDGSGSQRSPDAAPGRTSSASRSSGPNVETTRSARFLPDSAAACGPTGLLADRWAVDRVFEPTVSEAERQSRCAIWRLAVDRSRGWAV